jgi:hypothetical protein
MRRRALQTGETNVTACDTPETLSLGLTDWVHQDKPNGEEEEAFAAKEAGPPSDAPLSSPPPRPKTLPNMPFIAWNALNRSGRSAPALACTDRYSKPALDVRPTVTIARLPLPAHRL